MRLAVFDYGAGNLHSIAKALTIPGVEVTVEPDPVAAARADALVLPGVGAFGAACERLAPGLAALRASLAAGQPCLGVCLGMQLLFESSEEGAGQGLGVLRGQVRRFRVRRVPQIGWNHLEDRRDPLFDASTLDCAYFANSYVCAPEDPASVTAWAEHQGERFPAAVRAGHVVGVQFHPEKSSRAGLALVRAFLDEARAAVPGRAASAQTPSGPAPGVRP
jgi:glutamine amidotransferase